MAAFATSRDGVRIAFEVRGTGLPALVLVHGWSCDRTYWAEQLGSLSTCKLVVAIDLAGHGESGTARQDWSVAQFGADVVAVVDQLALQDVILVGHSMGADVVLEASLCLADRVRGLILVDQYIQLLNFMTAAQVQERIAPFRDDFVRTTHAFVRSMFPATADSSLVERVAMDMSSAPQHIALSALEQTWNHGRDVPGILSRLRVPILAINSQGSADGIASMRRFGVEVMLMSGVGHFPMLESPKDFNAGVEKGIKALIGQQ